MPERPFDLTISAVLFRTDEAEVERMVAMVAGIPLRVRLFLIDNDPDKSPGERDEAEVTRIATGANLGYGRAQNIAIARSAGMARYHLVANTDVVFDGPDVARLVEYMDAHPDIGLCAPRVAYPDGAKQHLCRLLPTPADLIGRRFFGWTRWGLRREARYELRDWHYGAEADIPFLSGCFMLMRRSMLDQVGGFDPRFFLYWEDLDLSRRFHERSRTRFVPWVSITHDYRSRQRGGWRLLSYLVVNAARYFNKWGWLVDAERDRVNARTLAALDPPDGVARSRS